MANWKYVILVAVSLMSSFAQAVKPAPEFMEQVRILSVIEANINYCLLSSKDKKISSDDYLKFNEVSMRLSSIIEKIESKYNDNILYAAFKMQAYDIMNSNEFLQDYAKKYSRRCSMQMLADMQDAVKFVDINVNSLLKRK